MDGQIGSAARGEPVGVKGWLVLLCLALTVFTPLITIANLTSAYQETSPLFAQFPRVRTVLIVDTVLSAGLMCFSIYAGVALWQRNRMLFVLQSDTW